MQKSIVSFFSFKAGTDDKKSHPDKSVKKKNYPDGNPDQLEDIQKVEKEIKEKFILM